MEKGKSRESHSAGLRHQASSLELGCSFSVRKVRVQHKAHSRARAGGQSRQPGGA